MHELVINLHIHTTYSDGSGLHADILRAAFDSQLDVIIITDHNVLVQGVNGYLNINDYTLRLSLSKTRHVHVVCHWFYNACGICKRELSE